MTITRHALDLAYAEMMDLLYAYSEETSGRMMFESLGFDVADVGLFCAEHGRRYGVELPDMSPTLLAAASFTEGFTVGFLLGRKGENQPDG